MTKGMAKPKGTARSSKPHKSATRPKTPSQTVARARPVSQATRASENAASHRIDERIRSLGGWRAETLAEVRRVIHEADPDIVEECKWVKPTNPAGVPVWSHAGIVCTGESYKQVIKLTFARGASLEDPHGLFNASLEGNTRRAIDIREGESLNAKGLKALIQAAVAENRRSKAPKSQPGKSQPATSQPGKSQPQQTLLRKPKSPSTPAAKAKPAEQQTERSKTRKGEKSAVRLLSGGNPQIAKGDGDAPVQAYIAAMPGWKHEVGKRLDAIIARTVPNVRKAVRWNTPFYGIEGQGWFLGFHCITKYVKVAFFRGAALRPLPPGASKQKEVRYVDIYEDDPIDEKLMASWVRQASKLPGDPCF